MKHRHQQPLTLTRRKRRWNVAEIGLAVYGSGLEHPDAGIAATQWPANFFLISIDRLNRVPTWCPEERNQGSGSMFRRAFHRKRKRRIRILRWLRFGDIDVHQHGGASTLAVRRLGDFGTGNAKLGGRRGVAYSCRLG